MLNLYLLEGTGLVGYAYPGSEAFGLCDSDATLKHLASRDVGYLEDPVFMRGSRVLKEKWDYHHCQNLKVSGAFVLGAQVDGVTVYADPDAIPSFLVDGMFYINTRSQRGVFRWSEGQYVAHHVRWERRQLDSRVAILAGYASKRSDSNKWYVFMFVLSFYPTQNIDSEEYDDAWMWQSETVDYPNIEAADEAIRKFLKLGDVPQLIPTGLFNDSVIISWPNYPYTTEEIASVKDAFERLTRKTFDVPLIDLYFDNMLFYKAVDNFRPPKFSFLETFVGYTEMPSTVRSIIDSVYTIFGRKAPIKLTLKAIAGLYLIWKYVFKPAPHDIEIMRSWLNSKTGSRYDGAKLNSREQLNENGWIGWQQATIQLHNVVTDVPTDINDALDKVSGLSAADSFRLVPRAIDMQSVVLNTVDILPVDPIEAGLDIWNFIGYSFVLDWFTSTDDQLDYAAQRHYLALLPIRFVCQSVRAYRDDSERIKTILELDAGLKISATVISTKYERRYSDKVPELPLFSYEPATLNSVWLQGVALLAQRVL